MYDVVFLSEFLKKSILACSSSLSLENGGTQSKANPFASN
jgi:hypothetical protein